MKRRSEKGRVGEDNERDMKKEERESKPLHLDRVSFSSTFVIC